MGAQQKKVIENKYNKPKYHHKAKHGKKEHNPKYLMIQKATKTRDKIFGYYYDAKIDYWSKDKNKSQES